MLYWLRHDKKAIAKSGIAEKPWIWYMMAKHIPAVIVSLTVSLLDRFSTDSTQHKMLQQAKKICKISLFTQQKKGFKNTPYEFESLRAYQEKAAIC